MIMKKLMAMVVLSVFLASMIPAALAQEDTNSAMVGISNTAVDAEVTDDEVTEPQVERFVRDKVKKGTSIEVCAAKVKGVFSDVDLERARVLCKRFLENPIAISAKPKLISAENTIMKSVAVRRIQEMNKEEFREEKQILLEKAIQKCDETDDPETCQQKLRVRVEQIQKIGTAALTRVQNFEQRKLEKITEFNNLQEDKDFSKFKEENAFKARKIAETKIQQAKKAYLVAKEKFTNARNKADETKDKFKLAKEKVLKCKGDEGEECEGIRAQINTKAKEHVMNIADVILEHLNKIKSRVESNEDLSDEEAAEMIAELDAQIAEIEAAKETIEISESKEEIIKATKEIKNSWQRMKKNVEVTVGKLVNARIGGIIVKSEQLQIKLERIMERIAEEGTDTTELESLVDEFNISIETAKEKYKLAIEKFTEAKNNTITPDTALIREGQEFMKDAHAALQDAQKTLRDILHMIKQVGAEEELEEDESDEAAAEVDEEVVEEAEEEEEEEEVEE